MKNKLYTKTEVLELVARLLDSDLENGIQGSGSDCQEREAVMASKYREYYSYVNENGEKETVRIYGSDKNDTDLKFQQLCKDVARQNSKWNSSLSFREFIDQEYRPNHMVPPFIAETTLGKYEYNLRRYIYPILGDRPIAEITVNDIQSFRKRMAQASNYGYAKDLSSKSIEDMTGFLNKLFKVAKAMKLVEENPVKRELLKKVGEKPGHFKPLEPEDLDRCKKLIPSIDDEKVRLYAGLLFYNGAGMRPEEILGLRWEDICLEEGYAEIRRAVTYAGSNRHVVVKDTKTPYSVRGALLPKVLIDILERVRNKRGYLIHGRDPEAPIPYSGWQRTYRKMQDLLDIRGKYCNYDLRTTYATEMIEEGYSSALTAKMMGHKDSRMVETVYAQTRKRGITQMRDRVEAKNSAYAKP